MNISVNNMTSTEFCNSFSKIEHLLSHVNNVSVEDADITAIVMKKILKEKEKAVLAVHISEKGEARKIWTPEECSKNLWGTKKPDKKIVYATTYDHLIEKLFDYYSSTIGLTLNDYSFSRIWQEAEEIYEERHSNYKTIEIHKSDYKRYINEDLAGKDVRNISTEWLEDYTIKLIKKLNLTSSAYTAYKCVLNMTFEYASRCSKYIFQANPAKYMDNRYLLSLCKQDLSLREGSDVMHSPEEIQRIFQEAERRSLMSQFHGYYIYSYIIKAHYELGCRPGELVALKWSDIIEDTKGNKLLKIYAQQRDCRKGKGFEYVRYTKNEKGISKGGRYFPVTKQLEDILDELRALQKINHITSDFIFCNREGNWIPAKDYLKVLKSICDSLGLESKGSYAFRRAINAALDEGGMTAASRGKAIGNSAHTNVIHYTHPSVDYAEEVRKVLKKRNKKVNP